MATDHCHLCEQPLPKGQSFYEDHGVKVCLSCFRTSKRCQSCRFPSRSLRHVAGYGNVCEFCEDRLTKDDGTSCYICGGKIFVGASHYSDHGEKVCQPCFAAAKDRCFSCRFPQIEGKIVGFGGICRFCLKDNVNKTTDLNPILQSLRPFLKNHRQQLVAPLDIHWLDWRVVLGMQQFEPKLPDVKFFDELIRHGYPIFYLKDRLYIIPSLSRRYFVSFLTGQLTAADLCRQYGLKHLLDNTPFHRLARGWCHWIALSTARVLKYNDVVKTLSRFPETGLTGDFSKFLAMAEFRKPKEIIDFSHLNLKKFARKYL
jgi:hypothetical protein